MRTIEFRVAHGLGQFLVGLLQRVALGIDIVEFEITVGHDVAQVLSHGGIGLRELVGHFPGTSKDGLYILWVAAFRVQFYLGLGQRVEDALQVVHVVGVVGHHVAHHRRVAAALHEEPSRPLHLIQQDLNGGHIHLFVVAQTDAVGIRGMHGTDVLRTQCLQVFQQVPLVFQNGLPLIEYLHAVGTYFLQQFLVALGIQRGVNADDLATLLGHLAHFVQTLHNLLPQRFIIGPVVAASA